MSPSSAAARPDRLSEMTQSFTVIFDDKASRWLNEHPSQDALVIAYEDSRGCGGGHIRDVRLRRSHRGDQRSSVVELGDVSGSVIFIDRRIMTRLAKYDGDT